MFYYKDRNPKETVKILKNFFISHNLIPREWEISHSEIDSYSITIDYMLLDTILFSTNGKGNTIDYALASGYAEGYERFCNQFCDIPFLNQSFLQISALNQNIEKSFAQNSYLNLWADYNKEFINIFSNEKQIINKYLVSAIQGSGGMCAGNTLEEALVQGISELYEHYGAEQFRLNFPNNNNIYSIDEKYIKENNYGKKMIDLGYKVEIFDLSYTFQIPVLLGYAIKNGKIYFSFSSFPVLNVAIDRLFTEMYQGHITLEQTEEFVNKYFIGQKIPPEEYYSDYTSSNCLPDKIFFNKKSGYNFNEDFWLNDAKSSQELLDFYKKLSEKNNIDFWYVDVSLIPEIKAVQIISNTLPHFNFSTFSDDFFQQSLYYDVLKEEANIQTQWINFHSLNVKSFEHIHNIYEKKQFTSEFLQYFELDNKWDILIRAIVSILYDKISLTEFFEEILDFFDDGKQELISPDFSQDITIYNYMRDSKYNLSQKQQIIEYLTDKQYTKDELLWYSDILNIIKKDILEPLYNFCHTEEYAEIMHLLNPKYLKK